MSIGKTFCANHIFAAVAMFLTNSAILVLSGYLNALAAPLSQWDTLLSFVLTISLLVAKVMMVLLLLLFVLMHTEVKNIFLVITATLIPYAASSLLIDNSNQIAMFEVVYGIISIVFATVYMGGYRYFRSMATGNEVACLALAAFFAIIASCTSADNSLFLPDQLIQLEITPWQYVGFFISYAWILLIFTFILLHISRRWAQSFSEAAHFIHTERLENVRCSKVMSLISFITLAANAVLPSSDLPFAALMVFASLCQYPLLFAALSFLHRATKQIIPTTTRFRQRMVLTLMYFVLMALITSSDTLQITNLLLLALGFTDAWFNYRKKWFDHEPTN